MKPRGERVPRLLRSGMALTAVAAAAVLAGSAQAIPVGSGANIVATEGSQFSGVVAMFQESLSADARFVVQAYGDVLGRYPTEQELEFALVYLGGASHGAFAGFLLASTEYRTRLIGESFRSLLGRDPTTAEVAFWLGAFTTDENLKAALVGSAEYYTDAGGTDPAFVNHAYQDLLGRLPTSSELAAALLALGFETRTDFAASLLASTEARTLLVQNIYSRYLRRAATSSELASWLGALGSGSTDEDVAAALVGSNEYATDAQSLTGGLGSAATVTIDWGDGTSTTGAVSTDPAGGFDVSGTHTYAEEGSDQITVDVVDELGAETTLQATATVHDAPISLAGLSFHSVKKQTFTGAVASGSDGDSAAPASDLSATVSWGDGTDSTATITPAGGGSFSVSGSHVYKKKGTYAVLVNVNDTGGATATATGQATVTNK